MERDNLVIRDIRRVVPFLFEKPNTKAIAGGWGFFPVFQDSEKKKLEEIIQQTINKIKKEALSQGSEILLGIRLLLSYGETSNASIFISNPSGNVVNFIKKLHQFRKDWIFQLFERLSEMDFPLSPSFIRRRTRKRTHELTLGDISKELVICYQDDLTLDHSQSLLGEICKEISMPIVSWMEFEDEIGFLPSDCDSLLENPEEFPSLINKNIPITGILSTEDTPEGVIKNSESKGLKVIKVEKEYTYI